MGLVWTVLFIFHVTIDFGRQDHFFTPAAALGKPAADNFLSPAGMAIVLLAVGIGCIEKIDSHFKRIDHDCPCFFFICSGAKIHRSQTKAADLESGSS